MKNSDSVSISASVLKPWKVGDGGPSQFWNGVGILWASLSSLGGPCMPSGSASLLLSLFKAFFLDSHPFLKPSFREKAKPYNSLRQGSPLGFQKGRFKA